ncbi:hypothetical protein C6500_08790 [Candidatus Poribacteria bacterium]|nr:MAG: hypothetical protein C6500_08790 [Candidatus Poribacteria bacterium]
MPFVQTHTHLKEISFIQWGCLLTSFGVILLYKSVYTAPFGTLLSVITQKQVSFRDAFTLFHLANITRYLPGRIWGVVRMLSLSHQFGFSRTAIGSSLTLHVGIETALGGLIALSLLFSEQGFRDPAENVFETFSGQTLLLTFAVIGLLGTGILFCIPKVANHTRQFLKTLVPLLENSRLVVRVLTGHALLWICQGLAFFFVRSFAHIPWRDADVLTACFAFAWIVGFLSFLIPGGLGIREGLLGLLLANLMPALQARLVALLCRVWMLAAEMVLAGAAFLLHRNTPCQKRP